MQTRERAHFARSVFPFIKKKKKKDILLIGSFAYLFLKHRLREMPVNLHDVA